MSLSRLLILLSMGVGTSIALRTILGEERSRWYILAVVVLSVLYVVVKSIIKVTLQRRRVRKIFGPEA